MIADGGGKILIIQNDPVFGSTIAASLAPLGHTCLVVADPFAGIRYLRDFRPDLVLLDTNFPRPDAHGAGTEWREFLLLYMLQRQAAFGLRFMVLSDDGSRCARDQALAAGASEFFTKPLKFASLVAAVKRTLSKTPAE